MKCTLKLVKHFWPWRNRGCPKRRRWEYLIGLDMIHPREFEILAKTPVVATTQRPPFRRRSRQTRFANLSFFKHHTLSPQVELLKFFHRPSTSLCVTVTFFLQYHSLVLLNLFFRTASAGSKSEIHWFAATHRRTLSFKTHPFTLVFIRRPHSPIL